MYSELGYPGGMLVYLQRVPGRHIQGGISLYYIPRVGITSLLASPGGYNLPSNLSGGENNPRFWSKTGRITLVSGLKQEELAPFMSETGRISSFYARNREDMPHYEPEQGGYAPC